MGELELQQQVKETQLDIKEIKREVSEFGNILNELKTAIIGSKFGNDGGIVKRLGEAESEIKNLRTLIQGMEIKDVKAELYLKIIWGMGGAGVTGIFIALVNYYFKTQK